MPARKNKICACGKILRDGRCTATPSCSDFKRPHMQARNLAVRLREREQRAHLGFPTMREMSDAAARAMSRSTSSARGVGGDATRIERELAARGW